MECDEKIEVIAETNGKYIVVISELMSILSARI